MIGWATKALIRLHSGERWIGVLDWVVGVWIGIGFVDTRWILDCRRRRLFYITI